VKPNEYSRSDCSALIYIHGSHFGDLAREHVTMIPNPLPLFMVNWNEPISLSTPVGC
jgi:hypothetical protein